MKWDSKIMDDTRISRFISLVLRHKPETIGINLDQHGWAKVKDLIKGINSKYSPFELKDLERIVAEDEKGRYSFNGDKTKIRANQGHSIDVDVELKKATPPSVLYHGAATKFVDNIRKEGIVPKSRLYVHFSSDLETAIKVGKRHGNVVVFTINCEQMIADGNEFFLSENGVWLTKFVHPKYLKSFTYYN